MMRQFDVVVEFVQKGNRQPLNPAGSVWKKPERQAQHLWISWFFLPSEACGRVHTHTFLRQVLLAADSPQLKPDNICLRHGSGLRNKRQSRGSRVGADFVPDVWEESYSHVLGTSTSALLTSLVASTASVSSSKKTKEDVNNEPLLFKSSREDLVMPTDH